RPSLRSQLNQIRLWVRQGRTDAWIPHKLDISVDQLAQFKRDHQLDGGEEPESRPEQVAEPAPAPEPEQAEPEYAPEPEQAEAEQAEPEQAEPEYAEPEYA